jgi:hypothetical protein
MQFSIDGRLETSSESSTTLFGHSPELRDIAFDPSSGFARAVAQFAKELVLHAWWILNVSGVRSSPSVRPFDRGEPDVNTCHTHNAKGIVLHEEGKALGLDNLAVDLNKATVVAKLGESGRSVRDRQNRLPSCPLREMLSEDVRKLRRPSKTREAGYRLFRELGK